MLLQLTEKKIHCVQVDDAEGNHKLSPIHYTEGLKVSSTNIVTLNLLNPFFPFQL